MARRQCSELCRRTDSSARSQQLGAAAFMPLASLQKCPGRARRRCGCRVSQPHGCTSPAQHSPRLRAGGVAAVAAGLHPLLHESTACHSTVHAVCPDLTCCTIRATCLPAHADLTLHVLQQHGFCAAATTLTCCTAFRRRQHECRSNRYLRESVTLLELAPADCGSGRSPTGSRCCVPQPIATSGVPEPAAFMCLLQAAAASGLLPCCGGILAPVRSWAAAARFHWLLWGRRHSGLPQQASCTAATPVRLPKAAAAARAHCVLGSWHGSIAKHTGVVCCRMRE